MEMEMEMEMEIKNLVKVWISVLMSLLYCYYIVSKIPERKIRLLCLLPIICLFAYLPLLLSSMHLIGTTAFFITWLGSFKLILFAFDQGPLCSHPPLSLLHFIFICCLPIKIKQQSPPNIKTQEATKSSLLLAVKILLFALLLRVYDHRQHLHPNIILVIYCFHLFLLLEIVLAFGAAPARALLGAEIEPQSNKPYLSTSLQDFWGRRWNLMVTSILRFIVYHPIQFISQSVLGKQWATVTAVLATFLVSGLVHELIYYYLIRVAPTWEVTLFFVLHGICVVVELSVKKAVAGRWQLHRAISGPLTLGFVMVTAFWLFFPQILRNGADIRTIDEYRLIGDFVKAKLLK